MLSGRRKKDYAAQQAADSLASQATALGEASEAAAAALGWSGMPEIDRPGAKRGPRESPRHAAVARASSLPAA